MTDRLPKRTEVVRQRDYIKRVLRELDDVLLDDLLRRGEDPARDGWPSSSGDGRRSVGDVSRPTERAAFDELESPPVADPVRVTIVQLFGELGEAFKRMRRIERKVQVVLATGDAKVGRESSLPGDCRACDRPVSGALNDKLHGGFCATCRQAWSRLLRAHTRACEAAERLGQRHPPAPDRAAFMRERPKWQEAEKEEAS